MPSINMWLLTRPEGSLPDHTRLYSSHLTLGGIFVMLRNQAPVCMAQAGGGPGAGAHDDRWLTLTQLIPTMHGPESGETVVTPAQVGSAWLWVMQVWVSCF